MKCSMDLEVTGLLFYFIDSMASIEETIVSSNLKTVPAFFFWVTNPFPNHDTQTYYKF